MDCPRCEGLGYLDIYFGAFDMREEECEDCEGTGDIGEVDDEIDWD